ncbi:nitrate chemoreceptor McpN [Oceanisphaera sediminis]|uniref:Nitrate chemoreceptor McpN n=1 Tax=Oceanisphaera sediminis TaxID=981381 RepID=A0ABP7EPQ6_9GAMM
MKGSMAKTMDNILRAVGCKTINRQFMLSYALIFLLAVAAAVSLYMSMAINPETINAAGRQRMLSQRMAKEAMLVAAKVEQQEVLKKTINLFEQSHLRIVQGDAAAGMNALDDPAIISQMQRVEALWQQYKALILRHVEQNSDATLLAIQQQSPVILGEMNKAVVMMTEKANHTIRTQLLIALGCILLILVLVVLGRVFGLRMLMDNILRLQNRMAEVGKGDFSHRFEVIHTDNEVGRMFSSYNSMLDHISDVLQTVQRVAKNTENHIDNVVKATEDAEQGVIRQYDDIGLVATAMTEMAAAVKEVSSNTSEAEKAATDTGEQARKGGIVVGQTESHALQMLENLKQTAQLITALKEETLSVGSVTSVIDDIAEQTNLLALNAAIEAARAGDQGRGFAVVADEVRTLAQRTQQSTQQIQKIIQQLQLKAEEAVGSMTQNNDLAQKSCELAVAAAEAIEHIIASVETISSMNIMISTATNQQSGVAIDIDQRIVNISDVAGNTREDANRVVAAIGEIRNEIRELNQLTHRFQLSNAVR